MDQRNNNLRKMKLQIDEWHQSFHISSLFVLLLKDTGYYDITHWLNEITIFER